MSILQFRNFGGEVPRLTKRDLPDSAAQICENLLADAVEFRPVATDAVSADDPERVTADMIVKTLYRHPTDSDTLIGTSMALSLVRSPIANDQYDRVYGSIMHGETEHPPGVLSTPSDYPDSAYRPLGVVYPIKPLELAIATVDDAFMRPSEVTDYTESVMSRIKSIVATAFEMYLWNPSFSLSGNAAFRDDPHLSGRGQYQRIWVNTGNTYPPTWDTKNGTPVANHYWLTQVANPAFYIEGSDKVFYANFPAKINLLRVASDVSTQTAALQALVIPGTSDRVLTDDEITALWAAMRRTIPDDPLDTNLPDLKTLLDQYLAAYLKAVNFLDQGFSADVTAQVGFQLVLQAQADLAAAVGGITSYMDKLGTTSFDAALLDYFRDVRFTGNIPAGEREQLELRYYTYTLVNDRGEESKPYLPGDGNDDEDLPFVQVNQAQAVSFSVPSDWLAHVSSNDHITHWRLYRSAAGADAAAFLFVSEIPIGTTSSVDVRRTESLSEQLQTTTWFPPPTSDGGTKYLKHLVAMPGNFLAGFVGNTVYFSEPNHPYAWPPEYGMPLKNQIIGLGVFGSTLVVLGHGRPVYISGNSPESMSKVEIESVETCASPRSIVPVSGGVVFAGRNGLCMATQSGVLNLTEKLFTAQEWQQVNVENLVCEEYNGVIYAAEQSGFMVGLHVASGKLVRINQTVTAFYADHTSGVLWAAYQPASGAVAQVAELFKGDGLRVGRWRSKRIILPTEVGFAWIAVDGEQSVDAPLSIDVYGYYVGDDGAEVEVKIDTALASVERSAVVTNSRPFRVGVGRFKEFEIDVRGACRITSISVASSTDELKGL